MEILKYRLFSLFFLLLVQLTFYFVSSVCCFSFFHKFMLLIGEMIKIPNQTEFLEFNCRYLVFFSIPNTNVGIGVSFRNIRYQFGERERKKNKTINYQRARTDCVVDVVRACRQCPALCDHDCKHINFNISTSTQLL